eukprot:TRINITY_DN2887_c0_g2_i3.p1 TRINITY_DN2887_c0_g2~~TRINITY_DN2887_c0_g2_i3.p1  ORF type:complete len:392 (+),score=118.69 TRINITY_DN2887_c0_g2_i3:305-1480(+)
MVDGISSCLLSLKKQPFIRYSGKSDVAHKTVIELQRRISAEPALYDFRKTEIPPLLLILDRRDDPFTPLLNQWTYQSMVHELIGIENNLVRLSEPKKGEPAEIVLSCEQDPWFKQSMYMNFGDLGVHIKTLVDEYQQKSNSNKNIQTLEDIQKFVDQFGEFKKMAGNTTKHVSLMSELSNLVDKRSLLAVSEVEQDLANNHNHAKHVEMVRELLNKEEIDPQDMLKIVILYAVRYEDHPNKETSKFTEKLGTEGRQMVTKMVQYAGIGARTGDVLRNKSKVVRGLEVFRKGIQGVENIYTEHKPLLKDTLDMIQQNRLKEADYPFAVGTPQNHAPQDVIVFICGGITFEEALTVHEFNSVPNTHFRVLLGGTFLHNSRSFLEDVYEYKPQK